MEPSQDNYPPDEPNTLKLFLSKTKRNDQDTDLYGSAEINLHGANGEIKAGAWINPIRNDPERFWRESRRDRMPLSMLEHWRANGERHERERGATGTDPSGDGLRLARLSSVT